MLRRLVMGACLLATLAGCDGASPAGPDPSPVPPSAPPPAPAPTPAPPLPPPNSTILDGSWRAVYWLATPADGQLMDVWELGGRITLTISDGHVEGSMIVPPDVTQGDTATADMHGVVLVTGDSARFVQHQDTFVQRATWTILGHAMYIVDHDVEGTRFTVVLMRGW